MIYFINFRKVSGVDRFVRASALLIVQVGNPEGLNNFSSRDNCPRHMTIFVRHCPRGFGIYITLTVF
jgi:hypothetical protein